MQGCKFLKTFSLSFPRCTLPDFCRMIWFQVQIVHFIGELLLVLSIADFVPLLLQFNFCGFTNVLGKAKTGLFLGRNVDVLS